MARGELKLDWADGEYKFKLALGQLRELQEKTKVGPLELLRRLHAGTWMIDDARETIRLGLIGGGTPAVDAMKLVLRYVDEQPATHSVMVAQAILMVALYPEEDPPQGKADRRTSEYPTSSPSPTSMEPVH